MSAVFPPLPVHPREMVARIELLRTTLRECACLITLQRVLSGLNEIQKEWEIMLDPAHPMATDPSAWLARSRSQRAIFEAWILEEKRWLAERLRKRNAGVDPVDEVSIPQHKNELATLYHGVQKLFRSEREARRQGDA